VCVLSISVVGQAVLLLSVSGSNNAEGAGRKKPVRFKADFSQIGRTPPGLWSSRSNAVP